MEQPVFEGNFILYLFQNHLGNKSKQRYKNRKKCLETKKILKTEGKKWNN